jgi:hypothetical protein
MGRIRGPQSYFLDLASEEVACSSGVLLSDANIRQIAGRYNIEELKDLRRIGHETVFRAEELEEAILDIRVAIGNLPDNKMGQFVLMDACREIGESGGDALKINEAYHQAADSGKYETLTEEAIQEIATASHQVDRSTTGETSTSRPSQSPPSESPSQGPAQDRRGEIDYRCAVQDRASLRVCELAEAQGSRRIVRGDRAAQAGYRHQRHRSRQDHDDAQSDAAQRSTWLRQRWAAHVARRMPRSMGVAESL